MRRTSLFLILVLAVVAGACGDDDGGPRLATIDEMRVVKVAGDQTTQVPDGVPVATIYATAGAALLATPGEDWTPEPLVARVEATVQSRGTGPSAVIPPGTLVHWQIPEVAGRLFGGTTATDDSAYVINRYAPGTKAGTYIAYAGRMVGSEIVIDAEWELVVEPGAVYTFQLHSTDDGDRIVPSIVKPGDQYDMRRTVQQARDRHGNLIPSERVRSLPDSVVGWQIVATDTTTGTGWTLTIPPADTTGTHCKRHPPNQYSPNPPLECWSTVYLTLQEATGTSNVRVRTVHE